MIRRSYVYQALYLHIMLCNSFKIFSIGFSDTKKKSEHHQLLKTDIKSATGGRWSYISSCPPSTLDSQLAALMKMCAPACALLSQSGECRRRRRVGAVVQLTWGE